MATPSDPLTEADLVNIEKALVDIDTAERLVERAVAAGIPVEDFRLRIRDAREKFGKIKQSFFPGK